MREGVRFVIITNSKDSVIGYDNLNGNMRAWRARCTIYVPQPISHDGGTAPHVPLEQRTFGKARLYLIPGNGKVGLEIW